MLFELLCIAGVGLIGYKAITNPKGTKNALLKFENSAANVARRKMADVQKSYENGEISREEYNEKKEMCQRINERDKRIKEHELKIMAQRSQNNDRANRR